VRIRVLASGLAGLALVACAPVGPPAAGRAAGAHDSVTVASFRDWNLRAENLSPRGTNPLHAPLRPGFRYVLEESDDPGSTGRVEVMESGVKVEVPAGTFKGCVRIRQVALTDPNSFTDRWWCPGVGLVRDQADGALVASDALKSDLSAFGQHPREKAAPQAQARRITPEQAQAIALKEVPGTFRDIVIERRGPLQVYVVEIIARKDGVETDVFVDVATGKVVATEK